MAKHREREKRRKRRQAARRNIGMPPATPDPPKPSGESDHEIPEDGPTVLGTFAYKQEHHPRRRRMGRHSIAATFVLVVCFGTVAWLAIVYLLYGYV